MNTPTIQPHQLSTDYKVLIEHLALCWVSADLSPEWYWEGERLAEPISYLYLDYLRSIGNLLLATQDPDRTEQIFTAVLNQAQALDKSPLWVEQELTFEGIIDGADRSDFLRFDLEQAIQHTDGKVTDELLDQYSERLKRFTDYD
ncbi:hypothetical protein [Spirosoma luteum]|uniref:hypothetical protein n=1 Tax=Spirosoma luteum TaxID=431553 RepID=UPI000366FC68|nr:hypothetical protein [Spirosoma luteum]